MKLAHAAIGLAAGTAVSTGITLAIQAFGDEPLATVQQHKRPSNHWTAGGTAAISLIGAAGFAIHASDYGLPTPKAVPMLLGASVGAATGAYLLAPAIRRFLAEH